MNSTSLVSPIQVAHMDLLNMRPFCEATPVPWFPSRNITTKPESLMLQDLYRTFANMEASLGVLKEQQRSIHPEDLLYQELGKSSLSVAGLLSNIRCALCLQGVTPTRSPPPERTVVVSDFYRKTEGCRVLWGYSRFVGRLAKVFRKEFARGRQKKRSRPGQAK